MPLIFLSKLHYFCVFWIPFYEMTVKINQRLWKEHVYSMHNALIHVECYQMVRFCETRVQPLRGNNIYNARATHVRFCYVLAKRLCQSFINWLNGDQCYFDET